jgi:hypothetical protein
VNTTKSILRSLATLAVALAATLGMDAQTKDKAMDQQVFYRTVKVDGLSIFYREAGPKDAPTILLLHGLPSSSRMFQPLLTRLADNYHLVAPDYPGFGHSDWPDPKQFESSSRTRSLTTKDLGRTGRHVGHSGRTGPLTKKRCAKACCHLPPPRRATSAMMRTLSSTTRIFGQMSTHS